MAMDRGEIKSKLDRARECLEANNDVAALSSLLAAWNARRAPEIAELIERLSARITEHRVRAGTGGGPVTAKTVKLRTEKWMELARKQAPEDVDSLVTTPWPGTWLAAQQPLELLTKLPDDPRVAMALARLIERAPYDTSSSFRFYELLLKRVTELRDIRTIPVLAAAATRGGKSGYWRERTGKLLTETIGKLRAVYTDGPPALAPGEEEEAFAAIALHFSDAIGAEKAKARGEAEFLEAIYDAPHDEGLRQVFADWLVERGDPRGELINIQLQKRTATDTRPMTEALHKREIALLKKNSKAWAGPLDEVLAEDGRVFEGGFLAEATLHFRERQNSLPRTLSDPAWATIHTLTIGTGLVGNYALVDELLALHSLRFVHTFRGLLEKSILRLASGSRPPLAHWQELDFHLDVDGDEDARLLLGAGEAFPSVTRLTLAFEGGAVDAIEWLLETALAKRAKRITVRSYDLAALVKLVERQKLPSLEELCATGQVYSSRVTPWMFTMKRDDQGRFTRLRGEPVGTSTIPSRYTLDSVLAAFVSAREEMKPELTEIVIPRQRACTYDEEDITVLEERFTKLTALQQIDVPWERVKPPRAAPAGAAKGTNDVSTPLALSLNLSESPDAKEEYVEALLATAAEPPLSLSFDSYSVNYGGKHTRLPAKGAPAKIAEVLGRKHTRSVRLYRMGESATCELSFWASTLSITGGFRRADLQSALDEEHGQEGFTDAYLAWLVRVLDAHMVTHGSVPFQTEHGSAPPQTFSIEPLNRDPLVGWITILGASFAQLLSFDELEELPKAQGGNLEWLRTTRSKRNLALVVGASPLSIPDEAMRNALSVGLLNVMWRGHRRQRGFAVPDLVREVLGPPLEQRGFVEADLGPLARALGKVHFIAQPPHPTGARALYVEPWGVMSNATLLSIESRQAPQDVDADLSGRIVPRSRRIGPSDRAWDSYSAKDEKVARASLEAVVRRLERDLLPWFERSD